MTIKSLKAVLFVAASFAASSAIAGPVTYIGADNNVGSLVAMTNSAAARAAFDTAVAGGSVIDFESALPGGVSVTGGSTTNNSGCGALCGFNTTVAGENFQLLVGGIVNFSFSTPVDFFGFYVSGLQTNFVGQQTVTFSDGSLQTINFPSAVQGSNGGGGAFIGFTDFGKSISSIDINVTGDIVAIDDVRYGVSGAVPEPASWAMMIGGLGLAGAAMRRRKAKVSFA